MEIDEEIKNKIDELASTIANNLYMESSVFINIQVEEEYSQYDVLFSYDFTNIGIHQRGMKEKDLLIAIVGYGCHGFSVDIVGTDPGYYAEKLGVHSNFLAFLFNAVREKLKEQKSYN